MLNKKENIAAQAPQKNASVFLKNSFDDLNDTDLVNLVKDDNDSDALSVLISRHSGICNKIYNKYFCNNTMSLFKDIQEQKELLIYQAVKTFDDSKGAKFSTWLGHIVTYTCLNACNSAKKEFVVEDTVLDYLSNITDQDTNINNKKNEILDYISDVMSKYGDDTAKEVIKMRYLSGSDKVTTFKEIADHFGVSTQTIVNWHDKFIDFLRNKLKSDTTLDIL